MYVHCCDGPLSTTPVKLVQSDHPIMRPSLYIAGSSENDFICVLNYLILKLKT